MIAKKRLPAAGQWLYAQARAQRCANVTRPLLTGSTEPWELTYSWAGGMGPGRFEARISSHGTVVFSHQEISAKHATVNKLSIPLKSIESISRAVDKSGLLCLTVVPREGYLVFDLGKFSLTVTQGSYVKNVYVDECNTVDYGQDLQTVINEIQALKPVLGPAIEWGPFATSTAKGSCNRAQP